MNQPSLSAGTLIAAILVMVVIVNNYPKVHAATAGITGIAYADVNNNGKYDPSEFGLPDIAISNGIDVAITDQHGRYQLPPSNNNLVFVIKPAQYRLPLDEYNKPRYFHYITDDRKSAALSDQSYDFPLIADEVAENFSILVTSDPQPYEETHVNYYKNSIISDIETPEQYRFGLTLGDIVGDRVDLFESVADATAALDVPWWYAIGNHDMDLNAANAILAKKSYREFFGPTTYAFTEGRVHFIVLDSVVWTGPESYNFKGGFSTRDLKFVEANLRHVPKDHLVVLAMHIPPLGEWVFEGTFRLDDRKRLYELLAGRRVLTLAGHLHGQWHIDLDQAYGWHEPDQHHLYIVGSACGDIWRGPLGDNGIPNAIMKDGTPNGYAKIHFKGDRYEIDWKVAGKTQDYRMRVYGPAAVSRTPEDNSEMYSRFFYVNFFMGYYSVNHIATPVEFRVADGKWQPMTPSFEPDPYRIPLGYKWKEAYWKGGEMPKGPQPRDAVPSLHLWKAKIPVDNDAAGTRTLEIRVTDADGRQYFDKYQYQVLSDNKLSHK